VQDAWKVSFEVSPFSTHTDWSNIVHFTIGKNIARYGDRVPGVWFIAHTTRLHICAPLNGNKNYCVNTKKGLPFHQYTKVEISQRQLDTDGSFLYEIWIAGKRIFKVTNNQPRYFYDVKVYQTDPWYVAGNANVRNLVHTNLRHGKIIFYLSLKYH